MVDGQGRLQALGRGDERGRTGPGDERRAAGPTGGLLGVS